MPIKYLITRIIPLLVMTFSAGIASHSQTLVDYPDVHVFSSSDMQSEVHISINPTTPNNLQLACNTYVGGFNMGRFSTVTSGSSWSGTETLAGVANVDGDPATTYDFLNNDFVSSLAGVAANGTPTGLIMQESTNYGTSWAALTNPYNNAAGGVDKEMIDADDVSQSPFVNNIYTTWDLGSNILVNHSADHGNTYVNTTTFNRNGRGSNVQTGPGGQVYVCWEDYGANQIFGSGIGFASSTNGGQAFTAPAVAFAVAGVDPNGNQPDARYNNIRVNGFPSMAVDMSNGAHRGRIYITYPEEVNNKAVIRIRFSDNQGVTWSNALTISNATFLQSFFPWISVDDTNGDVYVAYYAFDAATGSTTDVYVAYSNNAAVCFNNLKVSDHSFTTAAITGIPHLAAGYMGDYIGIAAHNGQAWAAWADNHSGGIWQVYSSMVTPTYIVGPSSFCCPAVSYSVPNTPAGNAVTWSVSPTGIVTLTQANNQATLTRITNGTVTLTASFTNACGTTTTITKQVGIGAPLPPLPITWSTQPGNAGTGALYLTASCTMLGCTTNSNYVWTLHPTKAGLSNTTIIGPSFNNFSMPLCSGLLVTLVVTTPCGTVTDGFTTYNPNCNGSNVVLTPNPAQGAVNVTMTRGGTSSVDATSAMAQETTNQPIYAITITDRTGVIKKRFEYSGGVTNQNISLAGLIAGSYFLSVFDGTTWTSKELIVK